MTAAIPGSSPPPAWPQTRAILLLANGACVTLARNAAPLPEVVADTAARLAVLGVAGWLAAAEFRAPGHRPRLRRFRQVIDGAGTWEAAAVAYIANWTARATVRSAPTRRPQEAALQARATPGGGEGRQDPDRATGAELAVTLPPYLRPPTARRARR